MNQINQGVRNKAGKGNKKVNIELYAFEPFMIVFDEVPEKLIEFKGQAG